MEKTLAIVGYSKETVDLYAMQINSLFSGILGVEIYSLEGAMPKSEIVADIILVESYDAFDRIKSIIPEKSEIIFAKRTISKSGLNTIMSIPEGTEAVIIEETFDMSKEMISILYQIGVRHLKLYPAVKDQELDKAGCALIIFSDKEKNSTPLIKVTEEQTDLKSDRIYFIGACPLDASTIIDIGIRAKLDYILNNQNIKKSYQEIVTVNIGLAEILAKTNRFESSLDILLGVFDQGVIAINSDGEIFVCNEKAKIIMGREKGQVIGQNGIVLFPKIPFANVLKNDVFISEKLEQIGGYDVIVSVNPIIHSEKKLGAVAIVKRFSEEERKQHAIRSQLIGKGHKAKYKFDDILGNSAAIIRCKTSALNMAKSDSSILISGESGTGKEMFAQAIHNESGRKAFQFVAVNCGALPESLLESELFGYEEGAFTGARKGGKPGLFELAHKGTLFLDEIGEMPFNLQKSLLRVLQEREIMRLGGDRLINVDIRLIAATNKNLKEMVKDGRFREDLFYRLNVFPLYIPPLRTRREDIMSMVEGLMKSFNWTFDLSEAARQALMDYSWRGNIRELRNCIEYITNMRISNVDRQDLPLDLENISNKVEIETTEEIRKLAAELIRISGKSLKKHLFVLQELNSAFIEKRRVGRRSLFLSSKESELFISEQEIRGYFIDLERLELVEVFPGRSGTVITETGRKVLEYLLDVNNI